MHHRNFTDYCHHGAGNDINSSCGNNMSRINVSIHVMSNTALLLVIVARGSMLLVPDGQHA
jgi:hypothetical protein